MACSAGPFIATCTSKIWQDLASRCAVGDRYFRQMRIPACQKHAKGLELARCPMQANVMNLHLVITVLKLVFASACVFLAGRRMWELVVKYS